MVRGIRKDTGELLESDHVQLFDGVGWVEVVPDTVDGRPKGRWEDNHCSVCGMMPMGEEMWTNFHLDAPRFDFFMDFCPCCGADLRGE